MRSLAGPSLVLLVVLQVLQNVNAQRLQPPRQYYQTQNKNDEDEHVPEVSDNDDDVDFDANNTERGMYLGSPCDFSCDAKLLHVYCDQSTGHCECDKKYPVKLAPSTGCGKPKKLGEQCYYRQSCTFSDQYSSCIQVHHNAICQCMPGYHLVSLQKPTKRVFCAEDLELLTSDFTSLAGVATGIAVLTGLICFVLHLFTQARSPRPRRFANANLAPPILFSSDTAFTMRSSTGDELSSYSECIPLKVHGSSGGLVGRSTSRASSQRTFVSTYSVRRPSSAPGSRGGVLVSASRAGAARAAAILLISCHVTAANNAAARAAGAQSPEAEDTSPPSPSPSPSPGPSPCPGPGPGIDAAIQMHKLTQGSRRPSLASVHSSGSSVKSYSTKRFEKEREQKEEREMHLRLAKMQQCMQQNNKPPTPSPQSTDELLPSVHRQLNQCEVPLAIEEECASTSFQNDILGPGTSKEFR